MPESNEMDATAVAIVLGVTCLATAVAVGLGLRALQKRFGHVPTLKAFDSKANILDSFNDLTNTK